MLYENHAAQLARYVSRRTAASEVQDVVADTLLAAWRRFDDLPKDPLPWLFVTARKMIANRRRAIERRNALSEKLVAGPTWDVREAPRSDLSEVDERLLHAIASLPDAQREAIMLVAWDGLNAQRAARAAGCSAATFRMRLHRARRRLKEQLTPRLPFAGLTEATDPMEDTR